MKRLSTLLLSFLLLSNVLANPYYVSPTGTANLSTDINAPGSIDYAFANAPTGATVYVKAGNYGAHNLAVGNSGTTFIGYTTTPGDLSASSMPDSLDTYLASDYSLLFPTLESDRVTGGNALAISSKNDVSIQNFYIRNYTYAFSSVGNNNTLEQIIGDGFGDITNSYNGKGFIIYGNNNAIRNSFLLNAAAEGITVKGNDNLVESCKVYCNDADNANHGSTDYYILISTNSATLEAENNIVRDCYIERVGNLRHGGHGFVLASFYINKTCATGGGYCYDPKYENWTVQNNTIIDCTSKNISELTLLRGPGVQHNDLINLTSLDKGSIYITSGASFNNYKNCKIYNTKYYDDPNSTSVQWQAGVSFFAAPYGETTDQNVSGNGIGAFSFQTEVAAEGNTFTNCLFQNIAAGITLNSYSEFRDYDGNVVSRTARKIVKDNVFVNCSFLGSDRDTDIMFHAMRGNSGNKMINCAISGFERFEARLFPTSYTTPAIQWHGIIHADFEYDHCNFFNNGFNDQIPENGDFNGYTDYFPSGWSDTLIGKFINCNTLDPGYVDEANQDYHLIGCPSCGLFDKGLTAAEMSAAGFGGLVSDLEDNPRPQYDAYDIGVYERGDPCANPPTASEYYVAIGGSQQLSTDINNPGDIVYAFANAPAGATVHVKAGNYGAVNLAVGNSNTTFLGYQISPGDSYSTKKPKDLADYEAKLSGYASSFPVLDKQDRVTGGAGIVASSKSCVTIKNFLIRNYRTGVSLVGQNNKMENVLGDGFGNVDNSYNGNGFVVYGDNNEVIGCFLLNAAAEGYTVKGNGNLIEYSQAWCNDSISQYGATDYYMLFSTSGSTRTGNYNTMRNCHIERVGNLPHGGHGYCLAGWYIHKPCATGGGYCYDSKYENDELSYNTIENCTSTNVAELVLLRGVNTKHNEMKNLVSNSNGTLNVTWGASYNNFTNCKVKNTGYRKSPTSSSIYFRAGVSFFATPWGDTTDMNVPYAAQSAYPWQQDYTAIGNRFYNCLFENVAAGLLLSSYSEFRDPDGNVVDRVNRKIIKDNAFVNCTFVGRDTTDDCLYYAMRGTEGNQMINCSFSGFETYESRYFPTNNTQPVYEVHGVIPTFNTYNHCNFYNNAFDSQILANGVLPAAQGVQVNGFNNTVAGTFIDCNVLDPGFVDPANRDFRLQNCASCGTVDLGIDRAEMIALGHSNLTFDLDNIQRPQGAAYDIGAYERNKKTNFFVEAILEGPYDKLNDRMKTSINNKDLVPNVDPYVGTFLAEASLFERTGDLAIVDWVWLELRDPANIQTSVAGAAGLLQADGKIIHPSGREFFFDNFTAGTYHLFINHRNHLPALSVNTYTLNPENEVAIHYFQDSDSYSGLGAGQKELEPNVWGLFAGDAQIDPNGYDVNVDDKAKWAIENGIFQEYFPTDFDMDGDINGQDIILFYQNFGTFSAIPK